MFTILELLVITCGENNCPTKYNASIVIHWKTNTYSNVSLGLGEALGVGKDGAPTVPPEVHIQ